MGEVATPGVVATYLACVRMWARSAMQYRASLVLMMVNSALVAALELAAVFVVFGNVRSLGGFSLTEALYIYGTAQTAFFISDLLFTGTEYLGARIRMGAFDAFLVRPVGVLPQVFADQFTPRRLCPLIPPVGALVGAVVGMSVHWTWLRIVMVPYTVLTMSVHWTWLRIVMVPYTVLTGVAVFGAVWVFVGAFQVVVTDASEVMNVVTYGGNYMTSYPLALYGRGLMLFLTFGVPMAFVNWQPTLYVLGHPDPLGLPSVFRFAGPVFAALMWGLALVAWRAALRRHRSTGS